MLTALGWREVNGGTRCSGSTANLRLSRQRIKFGFGACDLIQWEKEVPHINNAKGGDFYLYPGFILYRAAREAFSLIQYHDVRGNAELVAFQEEEGVPSDSKVIGQTWGKGKQGWKPGSSLHR
jgi:hypothetical protein